MSLFLMILLSSFLVSLISFVGGALAIFKEDKVRQMAHFILSFAIGSFFGVSFLELIPKAIEGSSVNITMLFVFVGVLLFFIFEKFLFWHHCHDGKCPVQTYSYLILSGDFLHNFIDGIIIALAFLVDIKLGIVTSIAVALHEAPQEIADFGILVHGGFSRMRALVYNFFVALSVVAGAALAYIFGFIFEPFLPMALAITAGSFIYVAATDLMPELHESSSLFHGFLYLIFIIMGALLVMAPDLLTSFFML